ncbi:MAG: winged helix DNA-binding domain-containing protein, partial [Chloroflexota bacterium]
FILQKNYLTTEKATTVSELVPALSGLPSSASETPFLSAQTRLLSFAPDDLLTELYQTFSLIKSPLMRFAPYIVPVDIFPTLFAATVRQRNQALNSQLRLWSIERNEEIEQLGETVLDTISTEPLSAEKVAAKLSPDVVKALTQTSRGGRVTHTTNVDLALQWLIAQGTLGVSQTMPADWQEERPLYAPLTQWYPDLDVTNLPTEAEAQAALVRAYLAAFGPATEADISFWTGFGKSETARATSALSKETVLTMVQGIPGMLLLLKDQGEALKATEVPTSPVINILPADDPFTTAHRASRTRYFTNQKLQRQVFNSSGAAKPTIVVNGQIVGVWAVEEKEIHWRQLAETDDVNFPLIQERLQQVGEFLHPDITIHQDG